MWAFIIRSHSFVNETCNIDIAADSQTDLDRQTEKLTYQYRVAFVYEYGCAI